MPIFLGRKRKAQRLFATFFCRNSRSHDYITYSLRKVGVKLASTLSLLFFLARKSQGFATFFSLLFFLSTEPAGKGTPAPKSGKAGGVGIGEEAEEEAEPEEGGEDQLSIDRVGDGRRN